MRLGGELLGTGAVGVLDLLGAGRQQDSAAAIGDGLVEVAILLGGGEGIEGVVPARLAALQGKQRLGGPAELGVDAQSALGELAGGLCLALALGLEEQAAETQLLGVGLRQHGLEDAPRRGSVAGELRGLGAQEVRQRLVRQRLASLDGVARGERAIASADGDQAAGQGIKAALLTATGEVAADCRRTRPQLPQQ